MSEAPQDNIPLAEGTTNTLLDQIFSLIESNSLEGIKEIFERFQPKQRIRNLKSSKVGVTPLFLAIKYERLEITRYLVELWSQEGRHQMCEQWKEARHPLSAALHIDNTDMLELVARNLSDINDYVYGPFTPLILAICSGNINYVKVMIRLGAGVNIRSFCGISPLMLSVFSCPICEYLVTKNVNLNHSDRDGNTALHIAVSGKYLQSMIVLVNAGADVCVKNQSGLTPLMLSSINRNLLAVMYLRKHPAYSEIDEIEALEVLSACCVCEQRRVLRYWLQALKLRRQTFNKQNIYPPQDLLDFSLEFTTEAELERLQDNPLCIAFQGILVIERILGRNNYMYLYCLVQTSSISTDKGNLGKLWQLLEYIKKFCQTKPPNFVAACSQPFKALFAKITEDGSPERFIQNGGFEIFKLIAQSIRGMWNNLKHAMVNSPYYHDSRYAALVDSFLYMTSIIQNINLPAQYVHQIKRLILDLVRDKLYVVTWQSLLHRVIKLSATQPWASVNLIRLLLKSGADVESRDYFGRTPIKYALKYAPKTIFRDVAMVLSEYGCNIESLDNEGALLRSLPPLWNAADINMDIQLAYTEAMPEILEDFSNLNI